MAKYTVQDTSTGKTITFDWSGSDAPTDADMAEVFAQAKSMSSAKPTTKAIPKNQLPAPEWAGKYPNLYGVAGAAKEALTPLAEGRALAGGSILGTPGGPAAQVVGAGLGYAGARRLSTLADAYLGNIQPETIGGAFKNTGRDVLSGASMEAGGQIMGLGLSKGIEWAGRGAKEVLGASTGAGPGTMDEALKGSQAFKDAMRGKISSDEIVDNTKAALKTLKDQRAAAYQGQLAELSKNTEPVDLQPIRNKLDELLKSYNVKPNSIQNILQGAPEYDFSRSTLNKSASKDVQEIIDTVKNWGTKPGDDTPVMIDTLKRRIDDFYSESSQARAFVSSLRNTIKDTLVAKVPQYAEMTKGYKEATDLSNEIEKGLMLKSGQTADQTLRRLTSTMRENFEMRRDLVNILGAKAQQDLAGQIAGYSASQIIPRGLIGKMAGGSSVVLGYLNPKFWPILAASSPRAVGEFLNIYGKALAETSGASQAVGRVGAYAVGKALENNPEQVQQAADTAKKKWKTLGDESQQ